MVVWVLKLPKKRLPSFFVVLSALFFTSINATEPVQEKTEPVPFSLHLRELAWDRIDAKHKELETSFLSMRKRRFFGVGITSAAVLGGLGWLTYRWFYPSVNKKEIEHDKKSTTTSKAREDLDKEILNDFMERRTVKGNLKQAVIFGLSAAAAAVILKRFNAAWENAPIAPGNLFNRFWGENSNQIFTRYATRFLHGAAAMQNALLSFESGIALVLKSSGDQQLKILTCEDLMVAWEALVSSFEDLAAITAIMKKVKKPIDIFINDRAIQNLMIVFGSVVQLTGCVLQLDTIDKQVQIQTLATCRKLDVAAKQLVEHLLR